MTYSPKTKVIEVLDLQFDGENRNGLPLHELKANHVSDVLEGLTELITDFEKAGAFHHDELLNTELFVRPPKEGSFILEVCRIATDQPEAAKSLAESAENLAIILGLPTISQIIWWATKSARADVRDVEELSDGNMKVLWQDDTVDIIPQSAWVELNKRRRRRKRQLRKILRPLEDQRVRDLHVSDGISAGDDFKTYNKDDYEAVKESDEVEETFDIFTIDGRLSAIDFDDPDRWRVETALGKRTATVEDEHFLSSIAEGKPIRADDWFVLKVREDKTVKGERTYRKWTILEIREEDDYDDDPN